MQEWKRNAKIRKHKLKGCVLYDSDEEESEDMFGRTPYRKLTMPEDFTPPRKRSKPVVPDSDESALTLQHQKMEMMMMTKALMRKTAEGHYISNPETCLSN